MPFIRLLLIALTAFGLAPLATAHGPAGMASHDSDAPIVLPNRAARAATLTLLDARARLDSATPGERAQRRAELLDVAKRRHADLAAMVEANPAEFLRVALPADVRAGLPAEAAALIEDAADETGDLEVLHVDHINPADDFYLHFLHTPKGRFSLHFAGKAPSLATGARLRVRGMKLDKAIVLAAAGAVNPIQIGVGAGLPGTLGVQKTLAILVNFRDAPTQPFTVASAQSVIFGTTSNYDFEVSYQQTSLAGDVAGWFTIAESAGACNYSNIASQAQQAATAAGFALANYSRFVYVFPANTCGWWGLGTVGGAPSQAWIHTKYGFNMSVVGHEMGHNLGLYHSHSLDCGSVAISGSGCAASEYGDVFDLMGSASYTPHYNAFQKERLGWLNAGISPPLTTVPAITGTSQYTIVPIEDARNGMPRALKIPRSTACGASNEWLYVESRQAKGFDAFLAGNLNVMSGVLVHKVTEGNADSSYLLDMTPATAAWSDAALVAGQTFTDPLTGVGITPLSVGSSSSTIAVTFPPATCTRAAPTVTVTPGGTVYTPAGGSAGYAVAVTNNDSCGCAASAFDLTAAVPAGWGATSVRTAAVSPAGSASGNLVVTTAASAPAAFYPVNVAAANVSAPAVVGSVGATIAVVSGFAVSATTDKSTYTLPTKGKTSVNAAITTKVVSGATAVAGASVSVKVTDPAGSAKTLTGTTDVNGSAKVTYAMKAPGSRPGLYQVASTVTQGAISSTATTSFVLQ